MLSLDEAGEVFAEVGLIDSGQGLVLTCGIDPMGDAKYAIAAETKNKLNSAIAVKDFGSLEKL